MLSRIARTSSARSFQYSAVYLDISNPAIFDLDTPLPPGDDIDDSLIWIELAFAMFLPARHSQNSRGAKKLARLLLRRCPCVARLAVCGQPPFGRLSTSPRARDSLRQGR